MLTMLMVAAGLVLWFAPDAQIGKPLRRVLVEWPAARLSRLRPRHALLILMLAAGAAALIAVFKSEGAFLVAQGLPEALAAFAALDVATYLDVLAVAWLLAASVRLRAVRTILRSAISQVRGWISRRSAPRSRAQRSRPTASPPPANSDDEGWPAFALAV
jgi:hypothetical protein